MTTATMRTTGIRAMHLAPGGLGSRTQTEDGDLAAGARQGFAITFAPAQLLPAGLFWVMRGLLYLNPPK